MKSCLSLWNWVRDCYFGEDTYFLKICLQAIRSKRWMWVEFGSWLLLVLTWTFGGTPSFKSSLNTYVCFEYLFSKNVEQVFLFPKAAKLHIRWVGAGVLALLFLVRVWSKSLTFSLSRPFHLTSKIYTLIVAPFLWRCHTCYILCDGALKCQK